MCGRSGKLRLCVLYECSIVVFIGYMCSVSAQDIVGCIINARYYYYYYYHLNDYNYWFGKHINPRLSHQFKAPQGLVCLSMLPVSTTYHSLYILPFVYIHFFNPFVVILTMRLSNVMTVGERFRYQNSITQIRFTMHQF